MAWYNLLLLIKTVPLFKKQYDVIFKSLIYLLSRWRTENTLEDNVL